MDTERNMVFIDRRLTAQRYVDLNLRTVVVPFIHQHNVTFQQDNARARAQHSFSSAKQCRRVEMASLHLWDILDSRVRRLPQTPTTLQAPREALIQEWNAIPQVQIDRLILSMTRRVRAALNANGGHTRY